MPRIEDRYAGDVLTDLLSQPADADAKPTLPAVPAPGETLAQPANR